MSGRKKKSSRRSKAAEEVEEIEEAPESEEEEGDDEDDGDDEEDSDEEDGEEEDDSEEEEEDDSEEEPPEPARTLTKKEKLELFKEYQELSDNIDATREHLNTLQAKHSAKIGTIFTHMGKGPFDWKGQQLLIIQRKGNYSMRKLSSGAEKIG